MEYYSSLDASQLDSETPTVFEIISASQLEALLSPSLRYILVHYAQKYPGYLLRVANRFDELNLVLRTAIEYYFFKNWQGSFTENFYGLKRVSKTPLANAKYNQAKLSQLVPSMIGDGRRLSKLQRWVSIFEITGTAYLLEKFGYQYELLYSKYATNQLEITDNMSATEARVIWLKRLFVQLYPYVQSSLKAANLFVALMYLGGESKAPTLLTALFNINFSRLQQSDYSRNEAPLSRKSQKPNRVAPPSKTETLLLFLWRNLLRPSSKAVRFALRTFFPLAIFSLKFLEWWNNSEFAQQLAKSQSSGLKDVVPPPSVLARLAQQESNSRKHYRSGALCPLCKQQILNPAIIETGHVFCYTCIYNYLRDSHKLARNPEDLATDDDEDNTDEESDEENQSDNEKTDRKEKADNHAPTYNVSKGGRCPITGRKLLRCKYNALTDEFDVDCVRRLIF